PAAGFEAAYRGGLAALERRDRAGAVAAFREAARFAPKSASAHAEQGVAHAEQGDWEEAVKHYSRVLWLNPRLAPAWCNRGSAHCEPGRYAEAVCDCTEAPRRRPDYPLAHAHAAAQSLAPLGDRHPAEGGRLADLRQPEERVQPGMPPESAAAPPLRPGGAE